MAQEKYTAAELRLFEQLIGRMMLDSAYDGKCSVDRHKETTENRWTLSNPRKIDIVGNRLPAFHQMSTLDEIEAWEVWGFAERTTGKSNDSLWVKNTHEIRGLMDRYLAKGDPWPHLCHIIGLFLGSDHHYGELPSKQKPFKLSNSDGRAGSRSSAFYRSEMDLFAGAGYARKIEDYYQWTMKIGYEMFYACLWNNAFRSLVDLETKQTFCARVSDEADKSWRNMPHALRVSLYRGHPGEFSDKYFDLLCNHWDKKTQSWRIDSSACDAEDHKTYRLMSEFLADNGYLADGLGDWSMFFRNNDRSPYFQVN